MVDSPFYCGDIILHDCDNGSWALTVLSRARQSSLHSSSSWTCFSRVSADSPPISSPNNKPSCLAPVRPEVPMLMCNRRRSAQLDLAQGKCERHSRSRDQRQRPEHIDVGKESRLRLHLLADPSEGLLVRQHR